MMIMEHTYTQTKKEDGDEQRCQIERERGRERGDSHRDSIITRIRIFFFSFAIGTSLVGTYSL